MFELFKSLYKRHYWILSIIQRLEEVGWIKIEWRARRKIKSCFHYLIEDNEVQVNHFWRQFENEIRKQVDI